MKNLSLLLLFCITVLGCSKGDDTPASTATFTISGVRDADLTTNSTASFSFPISVSSSASETVSLYIDNLPGGVFANIVPSSGQTPFNATVTLWNDFSGVGGIFPVSLVGRSTSGTRSYPMNVKIDHYRGWQFGDSVYNQKGLAKDPGASNRYPTIRVFGGGAGQLTVSFAQGSSLPVATKTYKITGRSGGADEIQISMFDDPLVYNSTGSGAATGTFTFDTLGKFTFKCSNVEMSNGSDKKMLSASFSE